MHQNELKQKLRLHSPQNQVVINSKLIQNNNLKVNQSINNRFQIRMHSPQNDTQKSCSKGPLIQKNKFPKVFGEIKNINIQGSINTIESETKKVEIINHHVNLDNLITQSTKNTESKFDFENINYGQLKKNNKINNYGGSNLNKNK